MLHRKIIKFSTSKVLQHKLFMYKLATNKFNLYEAFKSLKARCVPGVDDHINLSFTTQLENSVCKLQKDLKSHKYKPSPNKIVYLSNLNGCRRSLGISSVRDKIVQTAFKKELELVYEPIFRDCSFGFRPKLSCHSALKRIKKK